RPPQEFRSRCAPETPVRSTRRLHAASDARLRALSPPTFLGQARYVFRGEISKILRTLPQTTRRGGHRQTARAEAADESTIAAHLRRTEVERLRGDARSLSRCVRLRHFAVAQGSETG